MHPAVERPLREAAVGAGDDVLPSDEPREAHDALADQLRVLDDIGCVADHSGNEYRAIRKPGFSPHAPFVLVARVGRLDQVGAGAHAQDEVDDVLQWYIRSVRARPAAPAYVVADATGRDAFSCTVDRLDLALEPASIVGERGRRHHAVVRDRGARVVQLEQEAGVDDRTVFVAHGLGDRFEHLLVARVVLVLAVGNHARRCRDRQESLDDASALERRLEVRDVALHFGLAGVTDRPHAHGLPDRGERGRRRPARAVELVIELVKAGAVGSARNARRIFERAALEAAQPLQRVLRPADRLAELAITGHIDAGLGLLAHNFFNRAREAAAVGRLVVGLAALLCADKRQQALRPDQAADVRGENSLVAAPHYRPAWRIAFHTRAGVAGISK